MADLVKARFVTPGTWEWDGLGTVTCGEVYEVPAAFLKLPDWEPVNGNKAAAPSPGGDR
jgi:hypothetical protein